ncbi:MAG: peptidoglycan DD-metalloendopeptidase family protein, partial [Thermodesulfobacteriota bacterium]
SFGPDDTVNYFWLYIFGLVWMLSILKTNIKIVFLSKQVLLVSCTILFFIGLITLLLSTSPLFAQDSGFNRGIVTALKLNIRKKPSLNSDIVMVVEQGKSVDIIEKHDGNDGWLTVMYNRRKGYIKNRPQFIKLIQTEQKKEEQQKIKGKIKDQKKMVETFSQKEVEIIEGLNAIDYALNRARFKVSALSGEIMHLERKIEQLNRKREQLDREIAVNSGYAGQRLKALYKMSMIGRLDAMSMPSSVFDFFLRQNSMKQIIKYDFDFLDRQNLDLKKFETVEQLLQKQIHAKTILEAQLNDQIRTNKKESQKRQLVLKEIRQKKSLSLAAVESLKQATRNLDNKFIQMQKKDKKSFLKKSSFSTYRGRLNIPVKGKIISKYGPSRKGNYKSFTFQKGIDIRVERGEPVKSVFKGDVMFAQWLKGYGNLLIINHGDNYYTLYAHVEEIFKKKGESVETGEVIATAGDTGSIKGLCLHFEVRHHGKPLNPMKWLKKGA